MISRPFFGILMKKSLCFFLFCLTIVFPVNTFADLIPDLWEKYLALSQQSSRINVPNCPGRLLRNTKTAQATFTDPWKYRRISYEVHFPDSHTLARTVYDLAIHAGDISPKVSRERVEAGVEGFHYSIQQICAWMNDVFNGKRESPISETFLFIGYLMQDNVVVLKDGHFVPSGKIKHVLAAADGKKRNLEENLQHERLHVFWDENPNFQKQARNKWASMTDSERKQEENKLKQYADNEELKIEEWAVRSAINKKISLKDF